jgi:hypothetical protein
LRPRTSVGYWGRERGGIWVYDAIGLPLVLIREMREGLRKWHLESCLVKLEFFGMNDVEMD